MANVMSEQEEGYPSWQPRTAFYSKSDQRAIFVDSYARWPRMEKPGMDTLCV